MPDLIAEWVRLHYEDLYRYAYRLSGSSSVAEDLTQETFCKAQEKQGQLLNPNKAKAWLYCILRHLYLQRLRRQRIVYEVPLEQELSNLIVDHKDVLDVDEEALQKALGELPEEFRTTLILYYFNDMDYRGIAAAMRVPIGTVMSRLARAKAFLRRRLQSTSAPV